MEANADRKAKGLPPIGHKKAVRILATRQDNEPPVPLATETSMSPLSSHSDSFPPVLDCIAVAQVPPTSDPESMNAMAPPCQNGISSRIQTPFYDARSITATEPIDLDVVQPESSSETIPAHVDDILDKFYRGELQTQPSPTPAVQSPLECSNLDQHTTMEIKKEGQEEIARGTAMADPINAMLKNLHLILQWGNHKCCLDLASCRKSDDLFDQVACKVAKQARVSEDCVSVLEINMYLHQPAEWGESQFNVIPGYVGRICWEMALKEWHDGAWQEHEPMHMVVMAEVTAEVST